jgi:hypothetical protein
MNVGDRFICYHNKKAVTGTIKKINEKTSYDIANGVKIIKKEIISDFDKKYHYHECFKISDDITPTFLKKIIRIFTTL